jgi:SAM-dependent methyltransferase
MDIFNSVYFDQGVLAIVNDALSNVKSTIGIGGGGKHFDARRIALTVEYMRRHGLAKGKCVEIGSLKYPSAQIIWSFFPEADVKATDCDLRYEALPFADSSVTNIICTEVIEHISDRHYGEATTLDGLFHFLHEVFRVLETGGRCLITTPNASSLWVIVRALRFEPPLMYDWHFREYTVSELKRIVRSVGFDVVEHRTEYSWHLWNFSFLTQFMVANNFDVNGRGDDQFLIIEKPRKPVFEPHNLDLPV